MEYHSIEAFIPSGQDFEGSRQLFTELGFTIIWETDDYVGFQNNSCRFILQRFHDKRFAENLMMRVTVADLDAFWEELSAKELQRKFKIKLKAPTEFPHGREVNMIDLAGVCWHFSAKN